MKKSLLMVCSILVFSCTSVFAQKTCPVLTKQDMAKYKPYSKSFPILALSEKEMTCVEQSKMIKEIATALEKGYIVLVPVEEGEKIDAENVQIKFTPKGLARKVTILGPKAGRLVFSSVLASGAYFVFRLGLKSESSMAMPGVAIGGVGMVIATLALLQEAFCDYTTVSAKNIMSEVPITILGLSPARATEVLKDSKDVKKSVNDFIDALHALNYGDPKGYFEVDSPIHMR